MTSYGFLTEGKSLSCSETGYLEAVFAGSFPPAAGKQKSTGLSLARVRLSFPKSNNSSATVLSACVQSAMSVCSAMYPFIAMQTYLTAQRLSSVQQQNFINKSQAAADVWQSPSYQSLWTGWKLILEQILTCRGLHKNRIHLPADHSSTRTKMNQEAGLSNEEFEDFLVRKMMRMM